MSEPIGQEFYEKYGQCEKCYWDQEGPCLCHKYRKQLNIDDVLKQIDIMLKNKFKVRSKNEKSRLSEMQG